LGFGCLKWAKEPKEGRILHGRLLLGRGGVLGGLSWGLMHEKTWRRLLVFRSGDLGQHSPFIYRRDFILEEGAWLWQAVCHLEGFLAIRIS
jgi:hypothetical protein